MLMQQVREVMTVNQEMTDESSRIWLTSEQMGFPLWSEFANKSHGEAGSSKQCNDQRTDQTAFFLALIITDFIRNTKRELYDEKLEDALEMLDSEWIKDDDTKTQCNRLHTSPLHRGNASSKNGPANDTVCTCTHLHTHIRTYAHRHTHTHIHTHTCAHTLTHTNTHIHTHTMWIYVQTVLWVQ